MALSGLYKLSQRSKETQAILLHQYTNIYIIYIYINIYNEAILSNVKLFCTLVGKLVLAGPTNHIQHTYTYLVCTILYHINNIYILIVIANIMLVRFTSHVHVYITPLGVLYGLCVRMQHKRAECECRDIAL